MANHPVKLDESEIYEIFKLVPKIILHIKALTGVNYRHRWYKNLHSHSTVVLKKALVYKGYRATNNSL